MRGDSRCVSAQLNRGEEMGDFVSTTLFNRLPRGQPTKPWDRLRAVPLRSEQF